MFFYFCVCGFFNILVWWILGFYLYVFRIALLPAVEFISAWVEHPCRIALCEVVLHLNLNLMGVLLQQVVVKTNQRTLALATILTFVLSVDLHTVFMLILHVSPQVGRLGELVTTYSALKRFFACMHNNMGQKSLFGCKPHLINGAN